jgi:sugar phosphate isomerase/epimerase
MKLSIILSTQPASFSALSYAGNLDKNLRKIKKMGFDGVELAVRDAEALEIEHLEMMLSENQLAVSAIGTGQVYGEEGLSFTHHDSQIRKRAVDRVLNHLELAKRFNAVVIIGLVRGQSVKEVGRDRAVNWLAEAIKRCALEKGDVRLAIEPINRYETDLLNTVREVLEFLDRVKLKNVGLLLDTFHMNIEEPSISQSIKSVRDRLFHFHIADSNRWYPGAGHLDFEDILKSLYEIRYHQFISAEILPFPDPDTSAQKTMEFFRKLMINIPR